MTGKLVTSEDGTFIGDGNYQKMTNLRYNPASGRPQGVRGMQAVNTRAISNPDLKALFHFQNDDSNESHLLVQGVSGTAGAIYDCVSALPAGGEFTSIFTESASSSTGRFSKAPAGYMAYANGKDTCLFGGSAATVGAFVNCDPYYTVQELPNGLSAPAGWGSNGSKYYDFTDAVRTDRSDDANLATLIKTGSPLWVYMYIGTPIPINAVNYTVDTPATSAGTTTVYSWTGKAWSAVSGQSDGTAVGGITMAQSGTISFTANESTVKQRVLFNKALFWYQAIIKGPAAGAVSNVIKLSKVTTSVPFQHARDIWDGAKRPVLYWAQTTSASTELNDETLNIYSEIFDEGDPTTYSQITKASGATHTIEMASTSRLMGVSLYIAPGYGGTSQYSYITPRIWTGNTWSTPSGLSDFTYTYNYGSLNRTGLITWDPPTLPAEQKKKSPTLPDLYTYQLIIDNGPALSARCFYVDCIPAPNDIGSYSFPVHGGNRLWLCEGNTARCSLSGSFNAFNGDDSAEFTFGSNEDLTAGAALFNQRGSDYHNIITFFKKSEAWVIVGDNSSNWVQYQVSNNVGCPAPGTLVSVNIPNIGESAGGNVLLWQGATGIHLFDGTGIINLHDEIANLFDQRDANAVDLDAVDTAVAWFDQREVEYHWCYASKGNTAPNKEFAFSFRKMAWFEVDRDDKVQAACHAQDTNGNVFTFGADSSGFVYQLESGATWDGSAITHTLRTGDVIPNKNPMMETQIRKVRHVCVGANSTTDNIAMTHYIDTASAGTEYTLDPDRTGYRIAKPTVSFGATDSGVFHSFELELDTSAESYGYEPIMLGIEFDETHKAQG